MRKHSFHKIFYLCLLSVSVAGYAQEAPDTWMPDTNLRQAIREEIGLPDAIPLEKRHLHLLARFDAHDKGIADITGIEFAINLTFFRISMNPITDLRPLAGLTQLEELHCWAVNPQRTFFDLQPLANLTNLTVLSLSGAGVTDISPLAGLINLRHLGLSHNQIEDFSPIAGLTNLRKLYIQENYGRDITPIASLNLTELLYDEVCEIPSGGVPALERIQNRTFPSVALWPVTNAAEDAQYDFFWGRYFPVRSKTRATSAIVGKVKEAIISHRSLMEMHPNLIILFPMAIYGAEGDDFLPDADVWLRDTNGERVFKLSRNSAGSWREYQLDFVKPHVQDKIVERIVGIAKCGLYDGIAIDAFTHNATGFGSRHLHPATDAEIIAAIIRILREARKRVRDDFLIVVNANRTKPIPYAEYVNGSVMEPGQDYPGGYTYRGLQELDDTLIWNDKNLRSPQINWSSVILIEDQPPDSPDNLRWVRLFTTRGIILADAYVEVHHTPSHVVDKKELWYSFWDAPLGHPIGEKGQLYNGREGLFIREFTNGWAVYNRSGKARKIQLPEKVSAVASGVKNRRWHTIPDLDGEIYLKSGLETPPTADMNGGDTVDPTHLADSVVEVNLYDINKDGSVDIMDVKLVALAFSQTGDAIENPNTDVNGDNTVDITDLLLVIDNVEVNANAPSDVDIFSRLSQEALEALDAAILRSVLATVRLRNDGSLKYKQAIIFLESLLAAVRPDETRLLVNFPNPFNPETWIPYHLANASNVEITIYDPRGVVIRRLELGHQQEGYYTRRSRAAYWDGRNNVGERVASGIYFYQLQADGLSYLRKMVIVELIASTR